MNDRDCFAARSQPVKDDVSDRSKPINDDRLAALEQLSALDQELELKHGIQGNPMIKPQVNNHPVSYAKNDEKRVFYDTKSPRNGALSGCETVPDPDSRVWETQRTPQPNATPPQGSVHGEGSLCDSRNAKEPVAWAALCDDGDIAWIGYTPEGAADGAGNRRIVPLYRQPQPTLTDAEREAVEYYIGTGGPERVDATLRGLLERTK